MTIAVGERVPSVTFMHMGPDGPAPITSAELFGGKRIALFGLPGAYTPVCSAQHLPGFVAKADALGGKGVDKVACVSVNDPFVMQAWGDEHGAGDKVLMLADAKGDFTRAIGLTVDLSDFGLGERSQRYSMIVDDGTVERLNVEDSLLDCGISSADSLVDQA